MKLALKILLILGVTVYLVYAIIEFCRPADSMVCTGVEVLIEEEDQVRLIDADGVTGLLARHGIHPAGHTFEQLDMHRIDSLLTASAYIDTAHCHHTPSGQLCIRVRAKHPVLHIMADSGDDFYIDGQGHVMPGGGLCTRLCVVTGHVTRKYASQELVELGNFLTTDPYWSLQAQQVVVDQQGSVEIVPRVTGHIIQIGHPTGVSEKLERVRLFYENGLPKTGWNKYRVINATFKGQIICKK